MSDGFDLDAVLASATPATADAKVCFRNDLLDRHTGLEVELAAAVAADQKRNKGHQAPAIAERIEALQAEIDGSLVPFRFQSIGRRAWVALRLQHPPTDEDKKIGAEFNSLTFPDAAIAASAVDPVVAVEDVARIAEKLNDREYDKLWKATLAANLGVVVGAPKSVLASAVLQLRNGDTSTTSPPTESLLASEPDDNDDPSLNTSTTTTGD